MKMSVRNLVAGSSLEPWARRVYRQFGGTPTRNELYDDQTVEVMRCVLTADSNCIDVGCHKGSMLRHMLKLAPGGRHHAFEPLPSFYRELVRRYPPTVRFHNLALGQSAGEADFQHVVSRPAYSGFRRRDYGSTAETVEAITVRTERLDSIIPPDEHIDFIKIDVEGAELEVLGGAIETIGRSRPVVVFEHGIGAAEYYGSTTEDIYSLLHDRCELDVSLLGAWLANERPLTRAEFASQFVEGTNYYFMAHATSDTPTI
jgi:FkbM family methyltransferase